MRGASDDLLPESMLLHEYAYMYIGVAGRGFVKW